MTENAAKILSETMRAIPTVIEIVKDLVAKGRTPEEIAEHLAALGPAPRADVDSVALAEAARLRGERG